MRAMPSPTESTCPTSATSASVPKSAICCFRMAEISAARISMTSNPLHRKLQARELALERCIDHARADLDHKAADQTWIDPQIDRDLAANRLAQLLIDGLRLSRGQGLGCGHFRRDLTPSQREFLQVTRDHALQHKEPTVAGRHTEEIARE